MIVNLNSDDLQDVEIHELIRLHAKYCEILRAVRHRIFRHKRGQRNRGDMHVYITSASLISASLACIKAAINLHLYTQEKGIYDVLETAQKSDPAQRCSSADHGIHSLQSDT